MIWLTRRSAFEYGGFLECVWRLADEPFDVVDLTDAARVGGTDEPIAKLAWLPPEEISGRALWDQAASLTDAARERYREMWRRLRAENAPFRVVAGDELVSAPITFFDDYLISSADGEWRKAALVIGDAMVSAEKRGHDVGDAVLAGRLRAIAAAGRLESQGDLSKPARFSEVRLPGTH